MQQNTTKPTKILFFLVDASSKMKNEIIDGINVAFREALYAIKELYAEIVDYSVQIAVLEISDNPHWMFDAPIDVNEFIWIDLFANGNANLGAAFMELDEKLSRTAFSKTPSLPPCICLFLSGHSDDNYLYGFDVLKHNKWFQFADTISVAVGANADVGALSVFSGNMDMVLPANVFMEKIGTIVMAICASGVLISSRPGSTSKQLVTAVRKQLGQGIIGDIELRELTPDEESEQHDHIVPNIEYEVTDKDLDETTQVRIRFNTGSCSKAFSRCYEFSQDAMVVTIDKNSFKFHINSHYYHYFINNLKKNNLKKVSCQIGKESCEEEVSIEINLYKGVFEFFSAKDDLYCCDNGDLLYERGLFSTIKDSFPWIIDVEALLNEEVRNRQLWDELD